MPRLDAVSPTTVLGEEASSKPVTFSENCEQLELFALTRFTVFLAYFSGLPVYSTTSYLDLDLDLALLASRPRSSITPTANNSSCSQLVCEQLELFAVGLHMQ